MNLKTIKLKTHGTSPQLSLESVCVCKVLMLPWTLQLAKDLKLLIRQTMKTSLQAWLGFAIMNRMNIDFGPKYA